MNAESGAGQGIFPEEALLPISALQHLLYCPRQCALIHLEQLWAENRFTAEGNIAHRKAHSEEHETRPGIRVTRSLPVSSRALGLSGQCDIVEFHEEGKDGSTPRVVPVEYKRGKPKDHSADEVQLCAQALCLEEMLGVEIPQGFLFYGKRKRRTPVSINEPLRSLTKQSIQRLRELIASAITPPALYDPRKCDACSLIHHCQPQAFRLTRGAGSWFKKMINVE